MLRYALSNLRLCSVTYDKYAPVAQASFSSPNSHLHRKMWVVDLRVVMLCRSRGGYASQYCVVTYVFV